MNALILNRLVARTELTVDLTITLWYLYRGYTKELKELQDKDPTFALSSNPEYLVEYEYLTSDYQPTPKSLKLLGDVHYVESWINEYRDLFPSGVYSGNRPVKGSRAACINKINKLLKIEPNLSKNVILDATRKYIERARSQQFKYMTSADYFIEKDEARMILTYVEDVQATGSAGFNRGTIRDL